MPARAVAAVVLALLAGLLVAGPAAAHTRLSTIEPADGASLAGSPAQVVLAFTGSILPISAVVVVEPSSGGRNWALGPEVADRTVTAALAEPLPAGDYVIRWRVVSTDGHPIEGASPFTVAGSAQDPGAGAGVSPAPDRTQSAAPAPSPAATIAARADSGPPAGSGGSPAPGLLAVLGSLLVAGGGAFVLVRRARPGPTDGSRADTAPVP